MIFFNMSKNLFDIIFWNNRIKKVYLHLDLNPLPTLKTVLPSVSKDWLNINFFCFGSWTIKILGFEILPGESGADLRQ